MFVYDDDLKTYGDQDLSDFENTHKVTLPRSYKKLMSLYGAGLYDDFLRVHPVEDIVARTSDAAEICRDYPEFYWPQSESIISIQESLKCLFLADSLDGDIIGYNPDTKKLYAFPRDDDLIFVIQDDFSYFASNAGEYFGMQSLSSPVFAPIHDSKQKIIGLRNKKSWFGPKSYTLEDISYYADKLEGLHEPEQIVRQSDESFEVIYSKRWASRLQLTKSSSIEGESLSIQVTYNPRHTSSLDRDIRDLFSSKYKIIP